MALVICWVDDTDLILFLTSFKLAILYDVQILNVQMCKLPTAPIYLIKIIWRDMLICTFAHQHICTSKD
jgi:hypothetical protein